MSDQRCLCPAPMVETVRDDAVERALRELSGEPGVAERAAVASLADRLTARLFVLTVASCPRHGAGARTGTAMSSPLAGRDGF